MSTYLVAFAVTDYGRTVAPADDENVELGVLVPEWALAETSHAKEVGRQLLGLFQRRFGIKYPLPKMVTTAENKIFCTVHAFPPFHVRTSLECQGRGSPWRIGAW